MRGGEWWRILVEEHYHEAAGTSYSDAQASGFEVLPDDVVIKSFLQKRDSSEGFEVKSCHVSKPPLTYVHSYVSSPQSKPSESSMDSQEARIPHGCRTVAVFML